MRFIPTTHMQTANCMEATSNGGVSGSFTSGSDGYIYHEFTCSNVLTSSTFQFTVTKGFTNNARFVVIGGGGAGGWDGTGNLGNGGGGGGAAVINKTGQLFQGTYSIQVGGGGVPADADASNPVDRTYNGGNGDYSEILGGPYIGGNRLKSEPGKGGYGDVGDPLYLHGGDSATGFTGGTNSGLWAGGGAGFTSNGTNGVSNKAGNGGTGTTVTLPYTSPSWLTTSKGVGGGGGAARDGVSSIEQGFGQDGGGSFSGDGDRYSGGGGGGGRDFPATPPAGIGCSGGDGIVIIYYPTGSCLGGLYSYNLLSGDTSLNACDVGGSTTTFYSYNASLESGSILFYDSEAQNTLTASFLSKDGTFYEVNNDGIITNTGICYAPTSGSILDVFVEDTGSVYRADGELSTFDWVTSSVSLEVWSRNPNGVIGTYDAAIGLNDQVAGTDRDFIEIRYRNVSGNKIFGSNFDGSTDTVTQPYGDTVNMSQWYHSILTWDSGSGEMLYYRDGTLIGSASVPTITTELNAPHYHVGKTDLGTNESMYIGEYRIYPFALNASQSLYNYNQTEYRYI